MTSRSEAEFEKLLGQTSSQVRAYMFCACRNWADADDLAQDCYLRALYGWNQFNGKASRKTWFWVIARRTCAEWFRQKQKQRTMVDLYNVHKFTDDLISSSSDQLDQIWQCLRSLGKEQSEMIQLRYMDRLSYSDIAQALGIRIGTARSRLHRSLNAIKIQLKDRNDGV